MSLCKNCKKPVEIEDKIYCFKCFRLIKEGKIKSESKFKGDLLFVKNVQDNMKTEKTIHELKKEYHKKRRR